MANYNFALVPLRQPQQFVQYSASLTQSVAPHRYCLGEQSIPHVSLCHFTAEPHELKPLWRKIATVSIDLIFETQRSKTYPGHPRWGGVHWVSLMPNNLAYLHQLHWAVANHLGKPLLNAAYQAYDPHLTLFNSRDERGCHKIHEQCVIDPMLKDCFGLKLGEIDEHGQLTHLISW